MQNGVAPLQFTPGSDGGAGGGEQDPTETSALIVLAAPFDTAVPLTVIFQETSVGQVPEVTDI